MPRFSASLCPAQREGEAGFAGVETGRNILWLVQDDGGGNGQLLHVEEDDDAVGFNVHYPTLDSNLFLMCRGTYNDFTCRY